MLRNNRKVRCPRRLGAGHVGELSARSMNRCTRSGKVSPLNFNGRLLRRFPMLVPLLRLARFMANKTPDVFMRNKVFVVVRARKELSESSLRRTSFPSVCRPLLTRLNRQSDLSSPSLFLPVLIYVCIRIWSGESRRRSLARAHYAAIRTTFRD